MSTAGPATQQRTTSGGGGSAAAAGAEAEAPGSVASRKDEIGGCNGDGDGGDGSDGGGEGGDAATPAPLDMLGEFLLVGAVYCVVLELIWRTLIGCMVLTSTYLALVFSSPCKAKRAHHQSRTAPIPFPPQELAVLYF